MRDDGEIRSWIREVMFGSQIICPKERREQ